MRVIWRKGTVHFDGEVIGPVKEDGRVSLVVRLDNGRVVEVPIEELNATD